MSTLAASTCNGRSEYCTRSYSNITFVGSHDSAFVGPLPQQNQNIDIKAQLDMGIRYLQVQTHHSIFDKNTLELCHTSCFLEDAGTLKSFLITVKKWLDANPHEVVTLLLTNGDSASITEFGDTFSSSGIVDYAFVPSANPLAISDWPTLGNLISSGKRLIVFLGTFISIQKNKPEYYTYLFRLRRQHRKSKLHPRRIRLLLRDSLRRHRRLVLKLQYRSTFRCLCDRSHGSCQPFLGHRYLGREGSGQG